MSMNIASCDDEPPDPPEENVCCVMDLHITLIGGGICFTFRSSSVLLAFRVYDSWRQIAWTNCRILRPAVDQRHEMSVTRRTATFWNCCTLRSLRRQDYLLRVTRGPSAIGALYNIAASGYLPGVPNRRSIENEESPSSVPPRIEEFRIPTIVVTPPPLTEYDTLTINSVPTPQDARFGQLLILPDPELAVINRPGVETCGRSELPKVFERRLQEATKPSLESETVEVSLDNRSLGQGVHRGRVTLVERDDEEEEEMDVRSWCG